MSWLGSGREGRGCACACACACVVHTAGLDSVPSCWWVLSASLLPPCVLSVCVCPCSISVSAERWVPLEEVKEATLLGWLRGKKAAG